MSNFPTLYEDELLYSGMARYHVGSGNLTYRQSLEDILGDNTLTPSVYLQSNIKKIVDNLSLKDVYNEKYLIYNHTLYPFYTAFMNEEFSSQVYKKMVEDDKGSNVYAQCGIVARGRGDTKKEFFRFCPTCLEEDLDKYGETYWHRMHQIPEYKFCTKHKVWLQNSSVPIKRYNKYDLIAANLQNCKYQVENNRTNYSDKTKQHLNMLAVNIEKIVNNKFPKKNNIWFMENYKNYLKVLNYSSINDVVNQLSLKTDFEEFYGEEILEILDVKLSTNRNDYWLKQILSKEKYNSNVIKNLLLIKFFDIKLEDIFNKIYLYEPFGKGKWPCLNKQQEHYKQNMIEHLELKYNYKTKCIEGIFTCVCGFKYKVIYKKPILNDKYSRKRMNDITSEKNFANIILLLEEQDYINDEDLGEIRLIRESKKISKEYREDLDKSIELTRQKHREIWSKVKKENPEMSKTELGKLCTGTVSWLYKFDKKWFEENSMCNKKSNIKIITRVDWSKRDDKIYNESKKIIEHLYRQEKDAKRVTISRIGKELNIESTLRKNLDKLPKTKNLLENETESVQDYRKRKIRNKIKDSLSKGENITESKLLKGMKLTEEEKRELRLLIKEEIKKL